MFHRIFSATRHAAYAAAGVCALWTAAAEAAPMVIDDFDGPNPGANYFIVGANGTGDPSPMLLKQAAASGILGGQRDSLVNVMGTAQLGSALGVVGWDASRSAGLFQINTTPGPGSSVTLQYDGVDADSPAAPASLVDNHGLLNVNLTAGGNNALQLRFASSDAPGGLTIAITAATAGGGTSTYNGVLTDHAGSYDFVIPFASFSHTGTGTLSNINSLTLVFNAAGVSNVDFSLDSIAVVPEPSACVLLAMGACGLLVMGRRWRKK